MKKFFSILFLGLLLGLTGTAQVKIGLPAGAPQSSAVLDLSNSGDGTRALILPRVASTATVLLPVQGMIVYDISSNCLKAYENAAWTGCLSQPTSTIPVVVVNCSSSAINGFYFKDSLLTVANTVTIVVANNSFSAVSLTPAITDIVLTGAGSAGIIVASASPVSVSPGSGGGSSTITYTLSGTPTTLGSFTATFTKLSLSCAKTSAVCLPVSPLTISNVTTPTTLPSTIAAGNLIDFTAAGGLNNTGISWVMSSMPATGMFSSPTTGTGTAARAILVAYASGIVTVVFTATNACGLKVTQTQTVGTGALYVNCATSLINGICTQGRALTASNTITMVVVNNAFSANTVTASIANIVLSGAGAAGMSVASVSPTSLSIPANGGSATFTYTLTGTPSALGALTATYTNGPLTCTKTGMVCLDISPITVTSTPSTLPIPIVAGNTITFNETGGTPNTTGIGWTMTSSPDTGIFSNTTKTGTGTTVNANLIAGASGSVTVTFSAANACGLIVTKTQTVNVGDALRAALSAVGCASCAAYDAAAVNDYVQVTVAEYDNFTTTIAGITNFGMKLADRSIITPGYVGYITNMFLNNIPTTAIPFAFSTKLDVGSSCVKLIIQSSNTVGATAEAAWGLAAGVTVAPVAATTVYFVIKKPNILMPVNTNIAVKGYYNGWGNTSEGSGADGASGSSSSENSNYDSGRNCTLIEGTVSTLAVGGVFPATGYLNYDIKWTTNKQW